MSNSRTIGVTLLVISVVAFVSLGRRYRQGAGPAWAFVLATALFVVADVLAVSLLV